MADKPLPTRPAKSPDLADGDPSSTPNVKNGHTAKPATSGTEQPARPSTPVAQTSANPDGADTNVGPPADGYSQRLPFLVGSPSYLKRAEKMGIQVEAFSLSPETTEHAMNWHEAQPIRPSAGMTGSVGQETGSVPAAGDIGPTARNNPPRPRAIRAYSWPRPS